MRLPILQNTQANIGKSFCRKKNGDFGRLGALTLTAKNAVEAAIDRVESFAMRQGVTNQEVMTMILK